MTNTTTKAPAAGTTKIEKLLLASGPLDAVAHTIIKGIKHAFEHEIALLEDKKKEEHDALLKLENFSHFRHGDHFDEMAWFTRRVKLELFLEEIEKDLKIIKALYADYFGDGTATTTTSTTGAPGSTSSSSTTAEPTTLTFSGVLSGENQVPPIDAGNATGTATLVYNTVTKIAVLTVSYSGITPTAAHIHKGAVGYNGAVVFPLDQTMNPIMWTSAPLTAAQEHDLKAGLYYVNLHTTAAPDGAIRAQLVR